MRRKVIVIGAGGHGKVIADIIRSTHDEFIGFLDDDTNISNILGSVSDCRKYIDTEFVIGIGDVKVREKVSQLNLKWYTAIHPTAVVSPSADIGKGTVVMPNAVINSEARIGKHCIVNTSSVVEHNDIIDDYVHISVGAKLGGTVTVGKRTLVGIGAIVGNNRTICPDCVIGAGAVVIEDIGMPGTYVGVPVRKVR